MKKQFLNLGKALNKAEQKQIFGGDGGAGLESGSDICAGAGCTTHNNYCETGTCKIYAGSEVQGCCV